MPSSVWDRSLPLISRLTEACDGVSGFPRWGPVYIVALTGDSNAGEPTLETCPISAEAVEHLLETRPELRLDGERPDANELSARVSGFWLPDEVILNIGLAGTSVGKRVGQYYRTPLGARKPHAGGCFLKLLACLDQLTVHFAACDDPATAESMMLRAFCGDASEESRAALVDPDHPFPIANLEWPPGSRKRHGILGAKWGVASDPCKPRRANILHYDNESDLGVTWTSRPPTTTSSSGYGYEVWMRSRLSRRPGGSMKLASSATHPTGLGFP